MNKGVAIAHSKINLGLIIGLKRPDGFHDLDSYFIRTSLADYISYEIEECNELTISIDGNDSYLEPGKMDLMEKAARFFSEETGFVFSLRISIEKHIPSQAGLGGGSSDAASVIRFLGEHFKIDKEILLKIGERVGSDVPFFITGFTAARVKGRGEVIVESELPLKRTILLIFPNSHVSTKDAFNRLDNMNREISTLPNSLEAINRATFRNDFELLLDGNVDKILNDIVDEDDYYSLSGSGSTWFILTDGKRSGEYQKALDAHFKTCIAEIK